MRRYKRTESLRSLVVLSCFTLFLYGVLRLHGPGDGLWAEISTLQSKLTVFNSSPSQMESRTAADQSQSRLILLWEAQDAVVNNSALAETGLDRFLEDGCPDFRCAVSYNSSTLARADAVVVFLRYHKRPLPARRPPHQRYVAFFFEPPRLGRAFRLNKTRQFNLTMYYRRDADVWCPYFRTEPGPEVVLHPPEAARRSRPVAWAVSNCDAPSERGHYVQQLQKHIQVDIYGQCGTFNCTTARETHQLAECYQSLAADYFFYLAFENSHCRDYVSEKPALALRHGLVPVVRGATRSQYHQLLPPGSFIHADDFEGPEQLAEYLMYLMRNHTAFQTYHAWRRRYHVLLGRETARPWCQLCRYLHQQHPPQWYDDLFRWWHTDAHCAPGHTQWHGRPVTEQPQGTSSLPFSNVRSKG